MRYPHQVRIHEITRTIASELRDAVKRAGTGGTEGTDDTANTWPKAAYSLALGVKKPYYRDFLLFDLVVIGGFEPPTSAL